jgi:uncharacterized protein
MHCFFVSDLHGRATRYEALFALLEQRPPDLLLLGGDLLPSFGRAAAAAPQVDDFIDDYFAPRIRALRDALGARAPRIALIMGNDDRRVYAPALRAGDAEGLWMYVHKRRVDLGDVDLFGYAYVPPTPFRLKDWERYDISRYTDPGCIPPEDGSTSVELDVRDRMHRTIQEDLEDLTAGHDLSRAMMLFHSPPYDTVLDRAALDGVKVDHAPLDVHVGSIAIRNLILRRQPLVTLHGHIHESVRITGVFKQQLGTTWCLGAAHDGPELAVVEFDTDAPGNATRALL